jgi:hypothetical protein
MNIIDGKIELKNHILGIEMEKEIAQSILVSVTKILIWKD